MEDKLLGALSLCQKAGALVGGISPVQQCLASGKAKLLLFAQDFAENSRKKALKYKAPGVAHEVLPLLQSNIAAITRKPMGVLAVTNQDLAALCQQTLAAARQHKEEPV